MIESEQPLDRVTAAEFATWFKALADPTRIQIVTLLARRARPPAGITVPRSAPVTEPGTRDTIIDRYSGLARTALAGGTIADCDPGAFADGRFGAAAYPGAEDVPEAALRASLGCGNPLA